VTGSVVREARLRPEAAHLYPGIPAGVWLPASDIGAKLLLQHLGSPAAPELGNRLLDERHFEFRGGVERGAETPLRTRTGDAGSIEPVS
jgi:hypothetical protein